MEQHTYASNQSLEKAVEDALLDMPEFDPPLSFKASVMSQVRAHPVVQRSSTVPVFRLRWIDIALTLFFAGMIELVLLLAGFMPDVLLPPQVRMELSWQLRWFQLQFLYFDTTLLAVAGMSAVACCAALAVFAAGLFRKMFD